jgi:hypothetical protein
MATRAIPLGLSKGWLPGAATKAGQRAKTSPARGALGATVEREGADSFVRGGTTPELGARDADDVALDVLRGAVVTKDAAARAEITAWVEAIDRRVAEGGRFTVLEHTAMNYLLTSGFFGGDRGEDDPLQRSARAAVTRGLRASWKNLTGKERSEDGLHERLPKSVLMGASRRARLYHAASFLPTGDREAQREASALLRDFVPEKQDVLVVAATLVASALSSVACQVTAAAVLSYGVIGLSECFLHAHLAHPRPGTLGGWILKGPKPGASAIERGLHAAAAKLLGDKIAFTDVSHQKVHHHLTFRHSYTEMFASEEEKAKVDRFIASLGDEKAKILLEEVYGSTLTPAGVARVMTSIAPQTAALLAGAVAFGASPWAYVPILLIAAMYPFTMSKVHPFLHNDEEAARASAGPVMRAILDSRWAAWACRNHWLHHQGPVNYNLSFPGADALLGTLLQPNLRDLFQMADEGTLHA